ncbi:MAG: DUF4212 domain-containing protein [Planctomycetes bacterium]|nr:DUF4212 domain-containing protein [Planctomycetota bacterium]
MPSVSEQVAAAHRRHWRRNVRLTAVLLAVWALVSLGCGVLFADALNGFTFVGFPLGFWFAQQGAIVTFVVLILVYAVAMGRLDRRLQRELDELQREDRA